MTFTADPCDGVAHQWRILSAEEVAERAKVSGGYLNASSIRSTDVTSPGERRGVAVA